jgi:hypothetical protein
MSGFYECPVWLIYTGQRAAIEATQMAARPAVEKTRPPLGRLL